MRIIHCADLHLDSKIEGLPTEKSRIRREEILHSFERMCDYAAEHNVAAIIIAGDMFDTAKVTARTKGRVVKAIQDNRDIDFIYLSGNHDEDNFISGLESCPQNLKVFGDEWCTYNYGNVNVSGVRFNGKNSQTVYDTLKLDEQAFNVVVMHGQVVGYKSADAAETVSIPALKGKGIDYLALGHYHTFSEGDIDERGKYVYSGCLDGRGFDETGNKGFVLIDVDGKDAEYQFVCFSSRKLYEYVYDLSLDKDFAQTRNNIVRDLDNKYGKNSLIKVVLKGDRATDFDVDKNGLSLRLNEEYFFVKVNDKTQLKINIDDYVDDKSILGEFIRSVWQSPLSEQEKSDVIMCGINALKGEEI